MKIDLNISDYQTKDAYVRAALNQVRDLACGVWDKEHGRKSHKLSMEIRQLSKQELARRVLKLMTLPVRSRAVIDDAMRRRAQRMRDKGLSAREIAYELGVSIPSVYNITK